MSLFDKLGIDEDATIDAMELERIKRALDTIKVEAAYIARDHGTEDTTVLLTALTLNVKSFRASMTPEGARKIIFMHGQGEKISFGSDAEMARKAEAHDKMAEELKTLKDTAENKVQAALPSAQSADPVVDAELEKLRPLVAANPALARELHSFFGDLQKVPEDQRAQRFVSARHILNGTGGWELVDDNGTLRPKNYMALLTAKRDLEDRLRVLEQEKRDLTNDLNKATLALDVNTPGSIGNKAAWLDSERDPSVANSLAYKLADASAQLADERDSSKDGSLAKQLADAKAAASAASTPSQELAAAQARLKVVDDKLIPSMKKAKAAVLGAKGALDQQRSIPGGVTKKAEEAKTSLAAAVHEVNQWNLK